MQKRFASLTLALILAVSMALSASAATPRYNSTTEVEVGLTFSGTTANCSADVSALKGSSISLEMSLYRVEGSSQTMLKSWSTTGTTTLSYSGTSKVTSGSYLLAVDITVDGPNGVDNIYRTATAVC